MKLTLPLFALIASSFVANGATIINMAGNDSVGQTLTLGPGTYKVSVVGTSTAGALYNGWNLFTQNYGTASAAPAAGGWTERFGISIGGAANTVYDLQGMALNSSAATALSAIQNSVFYTDHGTIAANSNGVLNTAMFTLTSTQSVNFAVSDSVGAYFDNWGGESLSLSSVTATPEPSTFGCMGLVFAGLMGGLCRKFFGCSSSSSSSSSSLSSY